MQVPNGYQQPVGALDLTALHGAIETALSNVFDEMGDAITEMEWFSSKACADSRSRRAA